MTHLKEKHVSEEMRELAERCEAATGPDRELDALIYETTPDAIDYQRIAIKLADASRLDRYHDGWVTVKGVAGQDDPYPEDLKRYTASIDAAMSLVPEGGFARIYGEGAQAIIVRPFSGGWLEVSRSALVLTPALALCAAALRAISTLREQTP